MTVPPTRDAIIHEVFYGHPIERVWQALTDRRELADWLMENDFEPELGRSFSFRDHNLDEIDSTGTIDCCVVELDPPRRLAYTWESPPKLHRTLVSWSLDPTPGGTRVQLVHSGFAAGGEAGLTIRDYLEWGWGGLLTEELVELLNETRNASREARAQVGNRG